MKRLIFFKYSALILLVFNIGMILFFFATRPSAHRPHQQNLKPPKELNLNAEQQNTFRQFANQHGLKMKNILQQQNTLLKSYFSSLVTEVNSNQSDTLVQQVQILEREKIESTYRHFEEIKSILRPDQYAGFEAFTNRALKKLLLETKKGPPPPKEN